MTTIHRTASFIVLPDKLDLAIAAIKEFTEAVNTSEEGCILYRSLQATADSHNFLHYMIFKDQEAEDYHRNTDHLKKFVEMLYPLLEVKPEFTGYNLVID